MYCIMCRVRCTLCITGSKQRDIKHTGASEIGVYFYVDVGFKSVRHPT